MVIVINFILKLNISGVKVIINWESNCSSKDDIKTAFGELVWYTVKDLQELYKDDTKPAIARIIANQIGLALKKGDMTKIKEILEHSLGKPHQTQEVKATLNNYKIGFGDGEEEK